MEDETIMVVEDDDATREFLADNLKADSYGVVTASTGREALNLLQLKDCHLLLLDVMLPDASGYELCRRLRESDGLAQRIDPDLPVIFVTARGSEADRIRGFNRGADDYVVKPSCSFRQEAGSGSRANTGAQFSSIPSSTSERGSAQMM